MDNLEHSVYKHTNPNEPKILLATFLYYGDANDFARKMMNENRTDYFYLEFENDSDQYKFKYEGE